MSTASDTEGRQIAHVGYGLLVTFERGDRPFLCDGTGIADIRVDANIYSPLQLSVSCLLS